MLPITIPQFLSRLRGKGVTVSLADGGIKLKGAVEALTADDKDVLEARHRELALYFAAHAGVRQPSLMPAGETPVAAESQQSWWGWVRESPFALPHERITTIETFRNTKAELVEAAVKQIVARHATLRSCFHEEGGKLTITLNAPENFAAEKEALDASLDAPAAQATAMVRAKEFNSRPLPVDGTWLVKIKIISWSSDVTVALLLNHILVDGISVELIRSELEDILSGKHITEKPPQFIDYAAWEQSWVQSQSGLALIDYWQNWLERQAGLRTPGGQLLEWQHGRNVNCFFSLAAGVRRRIEARALELKSSPFFLYLTLYAVSLAKWTGQDRFALRCVGDLRRSRALAPVVGFMTCADPIEVQVPSGADFDAVLKFITAEYYNAAMLRLPSMLKFPAHPSRPGIEQVKYTEAVAATINYMPDRKRTKPDGKSESGNVEDVAWPPAVNRQAPENWPALLWPIYLRLSDSGDKTHGLFQFNEAIVTAEEQASLMSYFFDAIAEVTGSPANP